jgi:HEAT repeat protein
MKTPDLKLRNLKKTRIPCPSFRRVYTFFTYSPRTLATPPNTFSLQKNTFKLRADQKQNPVHPDSCAFVLIRGFPPCKYLSSRGVAKFPAHPRNFSQSTFPSQPLPFTIFTPKIICRHFPRARLSNIHERSATLRAITLNALTGKPKSNPRHRLRRALFIALALTIIATLFALLLLSAAGTREEGFTLGSTTFTLEFDTKNSQSGFFESESWDGPTGEFSSGRTTSIKLPGGLLTLRSEYSPLEAIRRRLPNDLPSLTKLLDSRNRFEVFLAAQKISEMKAGALPALPKLFAAAERQRDVGEAIEVICMAAPKEGLPLLINALSSTNADFSAYCANILGTFGTNAAAAAPTLLACFRERTPQRLNYAFAYTRITRDCAPLLPVLRDLLRSSRADQQRGALAVLQECGTNAVAAVPDVITVIESTREPHIIFIALEALSRISIDKAAVLPLFLARLNPNDPVSGYDPMSPQSPINSMANLGSAAVPHLVALYNGTNRVAKFLAGRALAKIGPPAASHLNVFETELRTGDTRSVRLACDIISNLGSNAAPVLPTLTSLLDTPDESTRFQAALTLIRLNHYSDTLIRVLVDSFGDSSSNSDRAYKAIVEILRTNTAAAAVVRESFATNPHARAMYLQHSNRLARIEKRYNLPPGSLPQAQHESNR